MTERLAVIDAVVSSTAFCAVLAGALGYSYRIYRQRYLLLWAIFWALSTAVWGLDGLIAGMVHDAPLGIALRTGMTACSFGARGVLALSIAAYLGWTPPSRRQLAFFTSGFAILFLASAVTHWLAITGRIPRHDATPFRGYTLGVLLNAWLASEVLRADGQRLSLRLLGASLVGFTLSDSLDVALDLFVGSPWASLGPVSLLSTFGAHVCETLLATGMMVAAIGTEYERAEAGALALRERDARLHESQRRELFGRLAGGLAHDFNNLLTAVIAHLSFARQALEPGSEVRLDVETAEAAAERGARLTRQLLTFARRQPVTPKAIDLNELLNGLERLTAPLLGNGVRREVTLAPALWPVRADAMQLEQLVLNLILNARDAMPAGGTLRVETANEPAGPTMPIGERAALGAGDWVRLSVEDTGLGMDEATRRRAFEPFFTTKQAGTGLGLATVQTIVQEAGGHLALRSALGQGTCFTIWLPRLRESLTQASPAAAPPARGAETILLVEDDREIRALGVRALESGGYQVLAMAAGAEALTLPAASLAKVSLLITDVVMPGLDGPALVTALRALRPNLPVLFVSGYAPKLSERDLAGAALLAKPFTPEQLLANVRQRLDSAT